MDEVSGYEASSLERFRPLIESTEESYSTITRAASLEQSVRSISKVEDTPGLITLLQQILVLDPLRRADVSDLLNHPWVVGSSSLARSSSE